jgi:VanZ family protein
MLSNIINSFKWRFLFLITWTLLIFYLCLLPQSKIPHFSFVGLDKIAHFFLFGIFMFLMCAILKNFPFRYLIALLFSFALGIAIEFAQLIFKQLHRSFELTDLLADGVGALVFGFIYFIISKKRTN